MKRFLLQLFTISAVLTLIVIINIAISDDSKTTQTNTDVADTRVDNNGYWKKMAKLGLAELNPFVPVKKAIYTGSSIEGRGLLVDDSPDVCVTDEDANESENSIFVNPKDKDNLLNSNNSGENPVSGGFYGANDVFSFDGGDTWDGEIEGAGGKNSGDPTTAIGRNGRWFVGYINSGYGQGVSYSDDEGENWTAVTVSSGGGAILDKNHLWIDNSTSSPYEGNLYDAWTPLGGGHQNDSEIELSYSDDNGESWSAPANISSAVNAGSHNQGVNLGTGPNGEVYAVWAIYDSWPSDECALGFAVSNDGGETWEDAVRIIENIKGIRTSETSKNMRVNSFPSMDVDISNGSHRGTIYVVWPNIGEPGKNQRSDIDVYMIKSTDDGITWSDPIRVNQDPSGEGHEHYFAWITCDPETGYLSVIYYDDRNVSSTQCEVYCSYSYDAGESWEDIKVSDVAFTPAPIPGLAMGYFGDYLGITSRGGMVYPCWTDNRSGHALTYVSPFQLIKVNNPYNLVAELDNKTGAVELNWSFSFNEGFKHFKLQKDGITLGYTDETFFNDTLSDYGIYTYSVMAIYTGNMYSDTIYKTVQWGNAQVFADPTVIYDTVWTGDISTKYFILSDTGQLPLDYRINLKKNDSKGILEYCSASGGCGSYISSVQLGDINNTTECNNYADYTDQTTTMRVGNTYELDVTNGAGTIFDVCEVWIDWNQNEDFTDDYPVKINNSPGGGPYSAEIIAPPYAKDGETRMRIRITRFGKAGPCGNTEYGEVEDYSINVINWISITPIQDTINPGDSTDVEITVIGDKAEIGDHLFDIIVESNDPNNPTYNIPYHLLVVPIMTEVTATPNEVCSGGTSQLMVEAMGGTGDYTYSWTSTPEGYTSTEQNPVFDNITETTTFIVEVDDGENKVTNQATVTAHPLPDVNIGDQVSVCQGNTYEFDAGAGYASYLWQDGSTGQTFTTGEAGTYWVNVTDEFGCSNSDTAILTVNPLPAVELGPDTAICKNQIITLNAGNDGDTYLWSNGKTTQTIQVDSNSFGVGINEIWVEVTDQNSCSGYDTITVEIKDCYFGIDELLAKTDVQIYPNPNNGQFDLTINSPVSQNLNISIYTTTGDLVIKEHDLNIKGLYKKQINLNKQSSGVYSLVIQRDEYYKLKKIVIY